MTIEVIEVIELTERELVEYADAGYDATLLSAGMKVACDDELYLTACEVEQLISELLSSLKKFRWTDEAEKKARLAALQAALEQLMC